jgi:hypothetical protein
MFDDKLKFLAITDFLLTLILQAIFQSAKHLYEKREGSGSWRFTDPGGPKSYGSGSLTLFIS